MNYKKVVNFDIDTKIASTILGEKNYRNLYTQIKNHFTENKFIHIQGSTYISKSSLSQTETIRVFQSLLKQYPFLKKCIRDIKMSSVVNDTDLNNLCNYDKTTNGLERVYNSMYYK